MKIPQNTPKAVSRLRDLLLVKVRTTSSSRSMSNISFIVVFSCFVVCVFYSFPCLGKILFWITMQKLYFQPVASSLDVVENMSDIF